MNSLVEDISVTRKRITIEATAAEVEAEVQKSLEQVRSKARLSGFRPGKAPMSLIEKKYRRDVETEVLDRLIPDYYVNTIKSQGLSPLTPPVLESKDYQSKGDLKFVCYVEVRPPIDGLVYEGLPIEPVVTQVSDEDVEMQVKALASNRSTYSPVDRPIQVDDLVMVDMEDAKTAKKYGEQYYKVAPQAAADDISMALLGKSKNDTAEVHTTLPANFPVSDMAGKVADVRITIKDVKELLTAEIDDELAKELGVDTLDELKGKVRETMEKLAQDNIIKRQKAALIKSMVEKYDFELPAIALKAELDTIVQQAKTQQTLKDIPDEELNRKFSEDAIRSLKTKLIIDTIGEKENVNVSEADMRQRINEIAYASSMTPEALMQYYGSMEDSMEMLRYTLFREKVADLIYTKAKTVEGGQ
ncbi:MAG: trigger factor [Candidatus Magnetobacterium sp. LHC-1]|uniref:Trigger factor n=1 Tax=Candidatus Magnetobacterium casense TaxID=1455061 RepID=A0ABS6RW08_9BACT|nr:trigger factor [Candidatus Magnetobacterium casensis]MBF0607672.1 trigger factor [Nitrospirota bacterium]MBV6340814.1 trigger factor [Candidatus Magnetobacterium casensis]